MFQLFINKKIIMKEIVKNAKNIRKILLFFIDTELKKSAKKNNKILIDSKTSTELSKKYEKFSERRMEIIETYNCYQMDSINNNNYFHVEVSYSQFNNNYHVSYENKNFEKIESNDIVGKYIKEKKFKNKTKYNNEKNNYKDRAQDKKKIIIGDKKLNNRRKTLFSSIAIPQKAIMALDDNNSDNLNNKKDVDKIDNYNKIHNQDGHKTICANKKRKLKANYYEIKLKKYCSTLIITKKNKRGSKKGAESKSPPTKRILKTLKKHSTLKESGSQTLDTPNFKKSTEIKLPNSKRQPKQKQKEKILWKIPEKKATNKRARAHSIKDTNELLQTFKSLQKKNSSPKKIHKQLTTHTNDSKNKEIISQKIARKEKDKIFEENNGLKKMVSSGIKNKRKMFVEKATLKWSNKAFQITNKFNFGEQNRHVRKPLYKRANTINKVHNIFHFKGNELKLKDN